MWIYNGEEITSIEQLPKGVVGFVYLITNLDNGWQYIGRKILRTTRKTKISKREQEETNNRRKKIKIIIKESNWLLYTGSNEELNLDIKAGAKIKKEILILCYSKMQLNFQEEKALFCYEVLENDMYYNNNIRAHYYRSKLK